MSSRGWENMTIAEAEAHNARVNKRIIKQATQHDTQLGAQHKPSKYRNVKVVVDGERFDSQAEARHWQELKIREKAGEITELRRQVEFSLLCPTAGHDVEVARYRADFVFRDANGLEHVQDVKGGKATKTALYNLKKRWLYLQDGVEIEEIG